MVYFDLVPHTQSVTNLESPRVTFAKLLQCTPVLENDQFNFSCLNDSIQIYVFSNIWAWSWELQSESQKIKRGEVLWARDGDCGLESCSVKVTHKYSALLAKDIVVNNNNQITYAAIRQLAFDLGLKDIWRLIPSDRREYSFFSPPQILFLCISL